MVCSLNSDDYFESFFPLSYYARLPEVAFFHFWTVVLPKFSVKSSLKREKMPHFR